MAREVVFDALNEQVVLRAAISSPEARRRLVRRVSDAEFLVPAHAALWRAMRAMADGGLDYSPEAARDLLRQLGSTPDEEYIAELEATAQEAPNIDWHVQTLRWDSTRARALKEDLPDLIRELEDAKTTPAAAASSARRLTRRLEAGSGRSHISDPGELSRRYKSTLRMRRELGMFYPTGVEAMDARLTEGLAPGKTWVVVGLSGSGKSTYTDNLVLRLARAGRKVGVCCWEMGDESTLDVMVCAMTGIELKAYVRGLIGPEELSRAERATDWITKRVHFMPNAFFEQVESSGKRQWPDNNRNLDILEGYLAAGLADVWVYDLWDRILVNLEPGQVTKAIERQQSMHLKYGVCGIEVLQLNLKNVEKRPDKRPTREAVKGVGTYVEAADVILGIHRDAQFKSVPNDTIEAICLKQRKGEENWAIRHEWSGSTCQVTGGEEVPYDPGLDSSAEFGDLGDVGSIRTRPRGQKQRIGRRDQ